MNKIITTKWILLCAFCALLQLGCTDEPNPRETSPALLEYSFFVAGHAYGKPGVDNVGVHPPLSAIFPFLNERADLELGVFTGDVVLKSTVENWEELAVDLARLNVDSYIAPGNHDLGDIDLYKEYRGDTHFNFRHKGDLFVILETTTTNWNVTSKKISELQAEIDSGLSSTAKVFVFCHQLLWYEEGGKYEACPPNSTDGKLGETDFFSEFLPMLNNLEQEVVIYAGDLGAFENGCALMYEQRENVTIIGSGMGGGVSDNLVLTSIYEDGKITFEIIALNGSDKEKLGLIEDYRI